MDRSLARSRVDAARVARLGTVTTGGRPHLVPCCFARVDETVYTAVDAKPKSTLSLRRLENLRAHPGACLLVDHYQEDWSQLWWIRLDGTGRLVGDADERQQGLDALRAKYRQYTQLAIPGPVIAIDVTAWRSWP
jgi:PPOX class probable F420-dependent enzyme